MCRSHGVSYSHLVSTQEQIAAADARNNALVSAAITWLSANWGEGNDSHPCPMCGEHTWEVGWPVALPLVDPPIPGANIPHFPLLCVSCGNTILLNAFKTGILIPEGRSE